MKTISARLGAKNQIVVPKAVREALDIQPRDSLLFLIDGDSVVLLARPASFTEALRGLHRDLWPDADGWLEQERESWE